MTSDDALDEGNSWCLMRTNSPENQIKTDTPQLICTSFYHQIKNILLSIKYRKISSLSFSILFGTVSVIILWSELFLVSGWRSPVGYLMGAYASNSNENGVFIQAISFIALSYMSICTYWSLFRLNLGWSHTLQGPQLSTPSSLIFNGQYFSRLQFALGYNFLLFINVPK